jgi:hypothetical protein
MPLAILQPRHDFSFTRGLYFIVQEPSGYAQIDRVVQFEAVKWRMISISLTSGDAEIAHQHGRQFRWSTSGTSRGGSFRGLAR